MGAFLSVALFVILAMYTGYKISIIEGKRSIDVVSAIKENHFDDSHVFGADQGLNVAVAVLDP